MIRRFLIVLLVIVVFECAFSVKASAQDPKKCLGISTWWWPDAKPPGFFYYGPYPGTFVYLIAAHKCSPPPETSCSVRAPSPKTNNPIYLCTGDTFIEDNDVSLPGLGGGITLQRTWNSIWPSNEILSSVGLFGPNWRSTYEERIFMGGDNYLKYSRADGGYWSLGLGDAGTLVPLSPANVSATLSQTASYWLLKFQSGEQRQFSLTTGMLTAIVDRNGNTTQIAYDASNRLVSVTDPASRHLYFNYPNGSSYIVTSVTSDFGVTLSYAYDAQGRLTQVTKPDLSTITYTYNTQSLITSVTDSQGKVLESHTYDSAGRGLTDSRANGVNAVTVTYH